MTPEESALLRGFAGQLDQAQLGASGAHPRGNRAKDSNVPRTPSPVYHYENKSMFDDFAEPRGAIPEDRPMHTSVRDFARGHRRLRRALAVMV